MKYLPQYWKFVLTDRFTDISTKLVFISTISDRSYNKIEQRLTTHPKLELLCWIDWRASIFVCGVCFVLTSLYKLELGNMRLVGHI